MLAASEVVTNAIVHAGTQIGITVEANVDAVTVRVRDSSLRRPSQRQWGAFATTGRGLSLVSMLCTEYGVEDGDPDDADGKVVWFRIEDDSSGPLGKVDDASSALSVWDDVGSDGAQLDMTTADTMVMLVDFPLRLWLAAQERYEAVLRELLLAADMEHDADSESSRQASQFRVASDTLASLARAIWGVPGADFTDPAERITMDARLERGAAYGLLILQDVLDRGLRLCLAGELLVVPPLPEIVQLRDWLCEQIVAQLNAVPATAWPGLLGPELADDRDLPPALQWDDRPVRTSLVAVIAADDRNRIVAVSEPAAVVLGWAAGELIGRRLVSIIPQRLREAHVAGFTRYATTGREVLIGREVAVFVLRGDGREVACRLRLERTVTATGTPIYLGWLSPVD